MVLEAARAIAAVEEPPRRSIRFVLWGGEEQGQLGSTAFVRTHAGELDRIVAYLNSDAGTGKLIGWTSPGRDDMVRSRSRADRQRPPGARRRHVRSESPLCVSVRRRTICPGRDSDPRPECGRYELRRHPSQGVRHDRASRCAPARRRRGGTRGNGPSHCGCAGEGRAPARSAIGGTTAKAMKGDGSRARPQSGRSPCRRVSRSPRRRALAVEWTLRGRGAPHRAARGRERPGIECTRCS